MSVTKILTIIVTGAVMSGWAGENKNEKPEEKKDTVYVIREREEDQKKNICEFNDNLDKLRSEGKGFSFAFGPGFMMTDLDPVKEVLSKSQDLHGENIGGGYNPAFGGHGEFSMGLGGGVRFGARGWGSVSSFRLEYTGEADSTAFIDIASGSGGAFIEKAWIKDRMNYFSGITIGAGGTVVRKSHMESSGADDGFVRVNECSESCERCYFCDDNDYYDNNNYDYCRGERPSYNYSWSLTGALNGGATYSALPWLHIGAEGIIDISHSPMGFRGTEESYTTVNPGMFLKITLGTLG
ncbi:MAG: hypothetical protein ACLFQK_10645 [Fibrobacterota bacterium]